MKTNLFKIVICLNALSLHKTGLSEYCFNRVRLAQIETTQNQLYIININIFTRVIYPTCNFEENDIVLFFVSLFTQWRHDVRHTLFYIPFYQVFHLSSPSYICLCALARGTTSICNYFRRCSRWTRHPFFGGGSHSMNSTIFAVWIVLVRVFGVRLFFARWTSVRNLMVRWISVWLRFIRPSRTERGWRARLSWVGFCWPYRLSFVPMVMTPNYRYEIC